MYNPSHFAEDDPEILLAAMHAAPLATLIHASRGELTADLMPIEVARDGDAWKLAAHVARANPLWRVADGQPVLVVFQGPQAYVSPNWYPSKAQHGKTVPTWNYAVVQVHGTLRAIDDPAWVQAFVTRLTDRHEEGRAAPWHVADAPADYIAATAQAIVGLEIEVSRIEGKFKMSQNRSADDRRGVVAGLDADTLDRMQPDAARTADAMREIERRRADGA